MVPLHNIFERPYVVTNLEDQLWLNLPQIRASRPSMNLLEMIGVAVNVIFTSLAPMREEITVKVDDVDRTALVIAPENAAKVEAPLVLAFHGHGGNSRQAARSFDVSKHWPAAIVVYPQGLNTVTKNDPKGERPGWQNVRSLNGDRDLKFVDAVVAQIRRRFKVNGRQIFAIGHSNGGGFTYLLMRERSKLFAGYGPSAANGGVGSGPAKPVFHMAGRNDPLVAFNLQQKTMDGLFAKSSLTGTKEEWSKACTYYPSKSGTPVATYITDVRHQFQQDAMPFMVRFFKAL